MTDRSFKRAIFLVACLLVTLMALAGPKDFWETKPYTEWSAKEVEKLLLNNSPWTHELLLTVSGGGGGGGGSRGGGGGGGGGEGPPPIYISWYSHPIREAVVRQMQLNLPETPKAKLDTILNHTSKFHEFMITGYLPGGGGGRGQRGGSNEAMEKFKQETCLVKKGDVKIPLANLMMPTVRGAAAFLQFPREIDGQPTVTEADKEVRLQMKIGDNTYKFQFKLDKMVVKGKLEI